jgi:ribonuclease-3
VSPRYPIIGQSGPEHDKRFLAQVTWCDRLLGEGEGRSKKEAEVAAARNALERRGWEDVASAASDSQENAPTV